MEQSGDRLVFEGTFDRSVEHKDLGHIEKGTISVEHYWLGGWYSIFRFHRPDRTIRNYYCNVNMPPSFVGSTLDYVDLDLDIVAWPDGSYSILDVDEFEENARRFSYPESVRDRARMALEELVGLIESKDLPL
jgi:protein associated with RNAse G/E